MKSDDPSIAVDRRAGVEVYVLGAACDTVAEIVPAWGDSCIAFRVDGQPVLEPVPFETVRAKPASYGIPILFPFPNRIRGGAFRFEGREYRVDPPRHGLVRDKAWEVVASGANLADGAWLTSRLDATDHPETILSRFPFPFRIEVTHRVRGRELAIEVVASQSGERAMPTGFGIHPYFDAPEDGALRVPARRRWELVDNLPTGRILEVEGRYDLRQPVKISALSLDDVYTDLVADRDGRARCVIEDPRRRWRMNVEFDPQALPELVVYTPPSPRRAICIEPQSCPTDAFNLAARGVDAHVRRLEAGGALGWTVAVKVETA